MTTENTDDMNAKVARMVDMSEIKAIGHRFARGLDRCDRDIIESCFHEDGADDHGFFKGNASEFCDWVMGELKKYAGSQHLITTQNAEINGDSAVCESYFYAWHLVETPDGDKNVIAAGRYIDTMEKRNGEWKITLRQAVFDWNSMTDSAALPTPENDPRMLGGKFPSDESYAALKKLHS